MNIVKKILGVLLNIIMVIVFLFMILAIYMFIQVNILNKDYSNIFGYTFFEVKTGSMSGTLEIGDVIIVKILDKNDKISEKDIITYKEENAIITHRVERFEDDLIITKGDANNSEDSPIKKNQVIGKTIKIIPNVSVWIDVFKTKEVYSMVIVTVVLFLITFSILQSSAAHILDITSKSTLCASELQYLFITLNVSPVTLQRYVFDIPISFILVYISA